MPTGIKQNQFSAWLLQKNVGITDKISYGLHGTQMPTLPQGTTLHATALWSLKTLYCTEELSTPKSRRIHGVRRPALCFLPYCSHPISHGQIPAPCARNQGACSLQKPFLSVGLGSTEAEQLLQQYLR